MNSVLKEVVDEIKVSYEYRDRSRQLMSELVEYIVYKRQPEPGYALENLLSATPNLKIGPEDAGYIKESLVEIINTANSDELAGGAIETLSLFRDPTHVPMIRQKLELYLKRLLRANHPFTACIHALDNCGENLKRGTSFGIDEVEKNLKIANDYLLKHNKRIPW